VHFVHDNAVAGEEGEARGEASVCTCRQLLAALSHSFAQCWADASQANADSLPGRVDEVLAPLSLLRRSARWRVLSSRAAPPLTVSLDLDETLVHVHERHGLFDAGCVQVQYIPCETTLTVHICGEQRRMNVRPGAVRLLAFLRDHHVRVVLYTAASRCHADPALDALLEHAQCPNLFTDRIYESAGSADRSKDLRQIPDVDLRRTVHIGNAPHEFHQPANGYLVASYYHDIASFINEFELLRLWLEPIIRLVSDPDFDVRMRLPHTLRELSVRADVGFAGTSA